MVYILELLNHRKDILYIDIVKSMGVQLKLPKIAEQ